MTYEELKHVRKPLPGNGKVVALDTGALIDAEATAMLQALHSRSIGGVDAHLLKLAQKGAKQFMDTYYVGYGDKSIGDCGSATVFIEGVSMLAAKAVQDFQLYNGQESSTRYIDFSKQLFLNPHGSEVGADMLERLRAMHLNGLTTMKAELAKRHPKKDDEDQKVWEKAINARAFDVMRAFLPAGATTNLAWHGELRQMADHLQRLRHHPLKEVRAIAVAIREALDERFPSSFKQKMYEAPESYIKKWMSEDYYFDFGPGDRRHERTDGRYTKLEHDGINRTLLKSYSNLLSGRPAKTELPKFVGECGTMQFSFLLDFGSFRDLQRHRSLTIRMPLLTDKRGFGQWYLNQMPEIVKGETLVFLGEYQKMLAGLDVSPELAQYYVPMGYQVACRATGDLPAHVWVVELRSGISVHPTLRKVEQGIGEFLVERFRDEGLKLYIDQSEDRFNYKRGTQDIVERSST